jgi:hypothetical protein
MWIAQAMLALRQHGCRTPYAQPNNSDYHYHVKDHYRTRTWLAE